MGLDFMNNYILLSTKKWHNGLFQNLSKNDNQNWIWIKKKEDFIYSNIKKINPCKIFIPHWSYIIPKDIFLNYECIVFHMTDLPYGRGGSPLQNLIIRGFESTKISAIRVQDGIDTGDIYLKNDLELHGSAYDIFKRGNIIINNMIVKILKKRIDPVPQNGKVTLFKRRKPEQSNIEKLRTINKVYDYIRMLDADGYPKAYIENNIFKFEFSGAKLTDNEEILATVKIKKKTKNL